MAALEFRCSSLRPEHHLRTEKVYRVFNEEGELASLHSGAAGSDWQNLGVPRETDRFSADSNSRQQRRKVTIERLARLEGKLSKESSCDQFALLTFEIHVPIHTYH